MEIGGAPPAGPLPVDLRIGEFSLTGQIESVFGNRIVQFRCAKIKEKDRLRAWILHLVHCAALPKAEQVTTLVGEDETVKFSPVADAAKLLKTLLGIYWNGLGKPPHFFPASSFVYAEAEIKRSERARISPLEKARKKWDGGDWARSSEMKDASNQYCFGKIDPLDAEFTNLALEVFGPMLRHATLQP